MSTEDLILQLFGAAKGGQWLLLAALVITLATRAVDALASKVRPEWEHAKWLPLVSSSLSVGSVVVASLMAGRPMVDAVLTGVVGGATASGLWSLGVKRLPVIGKAGAK